VAAHDLDDHHPLVGLGGGLETVYGLGRDAHRRVEPEGPVGGGDVVVDGLRDADDRHARVGEHPGRGERALAADRDERVQVVTAGQFLAVLGGLAQPVPLQAGRAEDGAAEGEDAADRVEVEGADVAVEQTLEAVLEADDLVAVTRDGPVDDRPDHCVQARAVAARGEDSDAHRGVSPAR
jgi:hypothetical protein